MASIYLQETINGQVAGTLWQDQNAIAREFGIRPNNAIAMLEHIGLDCPGGVQFFPMPQNGDRSIAGPRPATYKPLSSHQIALRLKSVRDDDDATWLGKNESCSHRCMAWRPACPTNYYGAMASSPWVLAERTVWAE